MNMKDVTIVAAATAASIYVLLKLRYTLKEVQSAIKLLQRSASDTVEIAAQDVLPVSHTACTCNTATDIARDAHAIMLKTNDTAIQIAQVMIKTNENFKVLQLVLQNLKNDMLNAKLHESENSQYAHNEITENVKALQLVLQDVQQAHNAIMLKTDENAKVLQQTHDAIMLKTEENAKVLQQKHNAIMLKTDNNTKVLQQTYDAISVLPTTIDTTAKKYSMYLHNEHVEIISACSKK